MGYISFQCELANSNSNSDVIKADLTFMQFKQKQNLTPQQDQPKVNYTFNIKRKNQTIFEWYHPTINIYQGDNHLVKDLQDWTNSNIYDGIIEVNDMPLNDLTVNVKINGKWGESYNKGGYNFNSSFTINESNTNIDISLEPKLLSVKPSSAEPSYKYQKEDVIFNYELTDVLGQKYSVQEMVNNQKAIIFIFFRTTCRYSLNTLNTLFQALFYDEESKQKYKDKFEVFCFSDVDNDSSLIKFANQDYAEYKFFKDENNEIRKDFFDNGGYPRIAFVDYEGVVNHTHTGQLTDKSFFINRADEIIKK